MVRGEKIAEIPHDYQGVWNYTNVETANIPWEPLPAFLVWLAQKPHLFQCSDPVGAAIIKRVMGFNWTQIGSERFWYVHAPTRLGETYMDFGAIENNIQDSLMATRTVMFSQIDRVEGRYQERLLNILLARQLAGRNTLFSTFKRIESLSSDLQDFLMQAVRAE